MTDRFKRNFLGACIIIPFVGYCVIYYGHVIKVAPYRFAEFESFQFQYGPGDSLVNKYDSKTGDYQYVNAKDSLVKTKLHLTHDELSYLHHKVADLGFWDFPEDQLVKDTVDAAGHKPLHYYIAFNYKRKSKKVYYDEAYNGPPKLVEADGIVVQQIKKILSEAEEREKK